MRGFAIYLAVIAALTIFALLPFIAAMQNVADNLGRF